MKLLICTQAVDKNHPILGFFHRWIEEFSKHCESIHVICLYEGEHSLPANVHVHSLGKEGGESRIKYVTRFYSYIWKLRNEYDNVFVHMNQIYVILGGIIWRALGKKVGLWYAHGKVSTSLRLADKLSHIVFTSTKEGFQLSTSKLNIVGQGIDLKHFQYVKRGESDKITFITVGRISPSKNIHTLIEACANFKETGKPFLFKIVGTSYTEAEKAYEKQVRKKAENLQLSENIVWLGSVPQTELPKHLQEADIFIQDSTTQSLDKALLEAVACGCVVVSSNPSYASFSSPYAPGYIFEANNVRALFEIMGTAADLTLEEREKSMDQVRNALHKQHSVSELIPRIIKTISD